MTDSNVRVPRGYLRELVGAPDRGESVGDDDRRPAVHHLAQRGADRHLALTRGAAREQQVVRLRFGLEDGQIRTLVHEVVHALGDAVMRATGGKLSDDATVVCLDWYGGPPRPRVSTGGASEHHAST